MLGAIIGDIVGSRFEFNNTSSKDFKLFTKECSFTDDTICTVAIADALISLKPYKEKVLEWCRKYPNPMGSYGGSFARWIRSSDPQPYNSFGNGAAMRVSPISWWFLNEKDVLEQSEKTALISHNHAEGIKGAQCVAFAISILRNRVDNDTFIKNMNSFYPNFDKLDYPRGVFNETCPGTVPVCLKIILNSNSFENAIRNAIAFGGDSDTIGAIVGSMAEAKWGIPNDIYKQVFKYLPTDMLQVVGTFFEILNNRYDIARL